MSPRYDQKPLATRSRQSSTSASAPDTAPPTLFFAKEEDIPAVMAQEEQDAAAGHTRSASMTPSQPGTPAGLWSSQISSAPKSIGSLHLSDGASRLSDSLDSEEETQDETQQALMSSDSLEHQLIMPSLTMPDRRPFTPRGKEMGTLKVLVAGRKGKTYISAIQPVSDVHRIW